MRRAACAGVFLFGLTGAAAALNRPDAQGLPDALPSLVGGAAGATLLYLLAALPAPGRSAERAPASGGWSRRRFLVFTGATVAAGAAAGAAARLLTSARSGDAAASRAAVVLPEPASAAPPVPPGAAPRVAGISPFTTANRDFYRVDTALVVPKVAVDT